MYQRLILFYYGFSNSYTIAKKGMTSAALKLLVVFILAFSVFQVAAQELKPSYPRIAGYVGIIHPIVTVSGEKPAWNFDGAYVVGLPTGINIWKTSKIGFSAEFVPFIRAQNKTSKMNNFLFHWL